MPTTTPVPPPEPQAKEPVHPPAKQAPAAKPIHEPKPPAAPAQVPSPGRIVRYKLSQGDADAINKRRDDAFAYQRLHSDSPEPGYANATGFIAHTGNHAYAGDVCPAIIVADWGNPYPSVNLQVFLDGNDTYWATSRQEGPGEGRWAWPERS